MLNIQHSPSSFDFLFLSCSVEVKNDPRNSAGDVSWTHEISVIIQGNQVDLGQDGTVSVSVLFIIIENGCYIQTLLDLLSFLRQYVIVSKPKGHAFA